MNPIINGFTRLLDFKGREARKPFWIYAVFLYAIQMIIMMALMIDPAMKFFGDIMQGIQLAGQTGDETAVNTAIAGAGMNFAKSVGETAWIGAVANVVSWALVASITVRRLHDSNWSGWLVLVPIVLSLAPLPFQDAIMAAALADMSAQMQPGASPFAGQSALTMLISLLGYAVIGLMLLYGLRGSTQGDNDYGPQPEESKQKPYHPGAPR